MYDELVKRLRDAAKMSEALAVLLPHSEGNAMAKLDNEAADAIEEMSMRLHGDEAAISGMKREIERMVVSGKKPRWIPVTEIKPKTDELVIVAIHDDSGDTPYDVTNVGFYLDVFPLGIWVVENERCNHVTHWMPLPQPPKEGST